jgi:biotin carboxyl carrier protein
MTVPRGFRITIGERSWDLEAGAELGALRVDEAGKGSAGRAVLVPPDGAPRRLLWAVAAGSDVLEVVIDGWRFEATVEDLGRARLRERARRAAGSAAAHAPLVVRAPIPGRISSVRVTEDDVVEAGAALVTLDAMKMENVVRAPRAGTIGRVAVAADQTVELGDALLELG